MSKFPGIIIVLTLLSGCHSAAPGPELLTPAAWGKETFSLPPSFAPSYPFQGKEIIRFAPGWGSKGRSDYWSYAFLWLLEDNPGLTTANLEHALTTYYNGLVGRNVEKLKIPADKLVTVMTKLAQNPGGSLSWTGTVNMLDYMAQEPITLNLHIRTLAIRDPKQRCLFLEVSPASPGDGIWQLMDSLAASLH